MSTQAFLTTDERSALEVIATGDAPWNQRAKALLALDDGETDEHSAELAGLRVTQVRYWASRFERAGLEAFPDQLIQDSTEEAAEGVTALSEPAPTAVIPEPPKAIVAEEEVVTAVVAVEAEEAISAEIEPTADETPAKKKKGKKKKKAERKEENAKKEKKSKGKKAKDKKKSKKKDKKSKPKKSDKKKKKAKAKKKAKKK